MVLVLAIGNSLLQDEGVGFHLLQRLINEKPNWPVEYIDGGTLSFGLTNTIESCSHLIILDAVNLQSDPGTVKTFVNDELDHFLSKPGKTVHEVSLSDLFDIARLMEVLPEQRAMISIQPKDITWGEQLTAEVDAALPEAMQQIEQLLNNWHILNQETNANISPTIINEEISGDDHVV